MSYEPRFTAGDQGYIDGVGVVTILSWPYENEGYVSWEQTLPGGVAPLRSLSYYGENREGEPVTAAIRIKKLDTHVVTSLELMTPPISDLFEFEKAGQEDGDTDEDEGAAPASVEPPKKAAGQ